jgi:hypothetical protein
MHSRADDIEKGGFRSGKENKFPSSYNLISLWKSHLLPFQLDKVPFPHLLWGSGNADELPQQLALNNGVR